MTGDVFLEGLRLTKSYNGVIAVDGIDISVREGEVRAIVGENGAGKSTLMKMLTGIIQPDSGEIRIAGTPTRLLSPRAAAASGIAIVHQELHLVPMQSVADNLLLVRPPVARGMRRRSRAEHEYVHSMMARVGLDISPRTPVGKLSSAEGQMLEIAKALALDPKAIIFDEPTSALLPAEIERLFTLIETLRARGHAVLYVSHAIDDILRIADRVSVLRDGRLVRDVSCADTDREGLIVAMVDRPVGLYARDLPPTGDEVVLTADRVGTAHIRDLSLEVRAGEIVGFAGLMGCGMQEAGLALCGEHAITAGTLTVGGRAARFRSPREAAAAGISIVPEERKRDGIIPGLSVCENLHVGRYGRFAKLGFVNRRRLRNVAAELVRRFQVRLASIDQPIATLSGGNQQKVLIARCVQSEPRVLIVASPSRGMDIAAKSSIHTAILDLAKSGTAVILISPELEELLGLAHRIVVFSEGRMAGVLPRSEATPARILDLAITDSIHRSGHRHDA